LTTRRMKYGARQIACRDGKFDSKAEWRRWRELKLMERAGEISSLNRQVKFELLPAQYDGAGKLLERPVVYIADFKYVDLRTGAPVVEDVKGVRTKEYVIKRKLMLHKYGVRIREVEA